MVQENIQYSKIRNLDLILWFPIPAAALLLPDS
jgi:hypothetical protein